MTNHVVQFTESDRGWGVVRFGLIPMKQKRLQEKKYITEKETRQ